MTTAAMFKFFRPLRLWRDGLPMALAGLAVGVAASGWPGSVFGWAVMAGLAVGWAKDRAERNAFNAIVNLVLKDGDKTITLIKRTEFLDE